MFPVFHCMTLLWFLCGSALSRILSVSTGWVIDNPDVSQLIVTTQGVRSHIGAVLSGGTAINMAIVIAEIKDYFDYLQTLPGVVFDLDKLQQVRLPPPLT